MTAPEIDPKMARIAELEAQIALLWKPFRDFKRAIMISGLISAAIIAVTLFAPHLAYMTWAPKWIRPILMGVLALGFPWLIFCQYKLRSLLHRLTPVSLPLSAELRALKAETGPGASA